MSLLHDAALLASRNIGRIRAGLVGGCRADGQSESENGEGGRKLHDDRKSLGRKTKELVNRAPTSKTSPDVSRPLYFGDPPCRARRGTQGQAAKSTITILRSVTAVMGGSARAVLNERRRLLGGGTLRGALTWLDLRIIVSAGGWSTVGRLVIFCAMESLAEQFSDVYRGV